MLASSQIPLDDHLPQLAEVVSESVMRGSRIVGEPQVRPYTLEQARTHAAAQESGKYSERGV